MGLSNLGLFHTVVGVVAIIAAAVDFTKVGKVDLSQLTGKIYFYGTLITSLTALGLSKAGGFNVGHVFSLLIVILIVIAYVLHIKRPGNNKYRYYENFLLSLSFFLSLIPTVNETFTRIPVSKPLAAGPTDPIIAQTLLVLFILFVVGSVLQFRKQRKINNAIRQD